MDSSGAAQGAPLQRTLTSFSSGCTLVVFDSCLITGRLLSRRHCGKRIWLRGAHSPSLRRSSKTSPLLNPSL